MLNQSTTNKTELLKDNIRENDLDLYLMAELRHFEDSEKTKGDLKQTGYEIEPVPRNHRQEEGIACIFKNHLNMKKLKPPTVTRMEIMDTLLTTKTKKVRIITIYLQ